MRKVVCNKIIDAKMSKNLKTLDIIQSLVVHGADLNFIDSKRCTFLHNFVDSNINESDVDCLVKNGVDVNAVDYSG